MPPKQGGPGVRIKGEDLYEKYMDFAYEITHVAVKSWGSLNDLERQVWDSMAEELWERS